MRVLESTDKEYWEQWAKEVRESPEKQEAVMRYIKETLEFFDKLAPYDDDPQARFRKP